MKPWLTDVPVRVNVWIRPECQRKQFDVIRQARPSILFLISDGGRNQKEWDAIYENRRMIDTGIDWECTVYRLYEDHNNGMYAMGKKGAALIWEHVDRCVFLEDDQIPSVSYFRFCAELLEKYKDDERIEAICGMNHCGIWEPASSDYFFSKEAGIWGMAFWKRTAEARDPEHTYGNDAYIMNLLKHHSKQRAGLWEVFKGYAKDKHYGKHIAGGEFYHGFEVYAQHRLLIVPKYNMISNIGCTADSAHAAQYNCTPRAMRNVFNMKTYELSFPMTHAKYAMSDIMYEKKVRRIMGAGHPFVRFARKIESFFLRIRYHGLSITLRKITKKRRTFEK